MKLGIDLGTSSVKLAVIDGYEIKKCWEKTHFGKIIETFNEGISALGMMLDNTVELGITGANAQLLQKHCKDAYLMEEIPAIVEGTRFICPEAKSIIEIGSQGSRFIAHADTVPQFATNGHCAGGTGSFFEDQMSRLGLSIEDFSKLTEEATSVPRLSGRCAVFAKTDIIHRQQEGVSTADILLGLCFAMIKNYKAIIVGSLPIEKPIVFCGGVTKNTGVIKAIKETFSLEEGELTVPENAVFASAIGAAISARGEYKIGQIVVNNAATTELIPKASCCCDEKTSENKEIKTPLFNFAIEAMKDPTPTKTPESGHCALGIDIGSTSTDLVLLGEDGELLDYQYLRTAGNPKAAVQKGLDSIKSRFGELEFLAVGVTGSGRERIGRMIGADSIIDEITSQAAGAAKTCPDVDTVFEIGGQDSKFIALKDGAVVDFQMNKICAAGTGSFVEEQAARMGIAISDFGKMAVEAKTPATLGERCTVFIETAIASAMSEGTSQADIAAGLCYSIVGNYLHKVVGNKTIGQHIVLQGGVAYNPGIVAAFRAYYGDKLTVNPYFSISGAVGVASLALEANRGKASSFLGFEITGDAMHLDTANAAVRENVAFYKKSKNLLLEGYTGERNPKKKTVGVPYVLMIHKFFPMANAFFKSLGYNVILTDPSNEETIRLSQENARGETCYPVKLIYGHMQQLIDQKVDYIFLPTIHTMKHEQSHVEHNYGCVYMQTAAQSIARELKLEEKGITLLSPVFDLDFGQKAMASSMIDLSKPLGVPKPLCVKALMAGAAAVKKHTAAVEAQGQKLLASLKPDDKVLVLITRNYGVSDPILNMGIPQLLLERGYKVITLSHLPGHSLDISQEYPNLYWPFGQHIISGAKLIAHHPNLYAVYLTNHGCGPDTMMSHLFKKEMGDKPYLQIEVDEHFSKVGVITRIEAFLNSLSKRETKELPENFAMEDVLIRKSNLSTKLSKDMPVAVPDLGKLTPYIKAYLQEQGYDAIALPAISEEALAIGREYTSSKEYLPFAALLGNIILHQKTAKEKVQYLLWQTLGSEADGQYAAVIADILNEKEETVVVAPVLEKLPETLTDFDAFCRAIIAADLSYMAAEQKEISKVPNWDEIRLHTEKIENQGSKEKRLGIVGDPLCMDALNDGILAELSADYEILSSPLAEYLYFLWADNESKNINILKEKMLEIGEMLGEKNAFSSDIENLFVIADENLPKFAGGNGRYRYAKAMQLAEKCDAILTFAPRYENTQIILKMRGLEEKCPAPIYDIALDHDWDETAASNLRSFLYYI